MASCPNKNHPDWVSLVERVGEYSAMAMYRKNGSNIPNIMIDLNLPAKNEVSFKQRERIEKALAEYNPKMGVNHRIVFSKIEDSDAFTYNVIEDYKENLHQRDPITQNKDPQADIFKADASVQIEAPQEAIKALEDAMLDLMHALNVDVNVVNEILDPNGKPLNAVAKADLLNKVIEVVEGKAKVDTLPEEAAHFFVRMLKVKGSPLYDSMLNEIEDYAVYQDVLEEYGEVYDNNLDKIREEAIGKLVARVILAQHTDTEIPQKESRVKRWFDKVLNFFRKLMGRPSENPFVSTALGMMNYRAKAATMSNPIEFGNDTFYQTGDEVEVNSFTREDSINKLEETNAQFEVQEVTFEEIKDQIEFGKFLYADENGFIMRYVDVNTGQVVHNRVSDRAAQMFVKKKGLDKAKEIGALPENIIKRQTGTRLHNTMEDLVNLIYRGQGSEADIQKRSKLTPAQFGKLKREASRLINEARKTQDSIDTEGKFTILTEQKLHDPDGKKGVVSEGTVGTVDLMVVYSDNTADIYDYKFISPRANQSTSTIGFGKNLKIIANPVGYKMDQYRSQMVSYKDILQRQYGIKNVRKSRMNIIHIQYAMEKKEGQYRMTDSIVKLETGADNKFLGEMPVADEMFGDAGIDKLIFQFTSKRRILEKKSQATQDQVKRDKLNQEILVLDDAIRTLRLGGGIDNLFYDARTKMQIIDRKLGLPKEDPNYMSDSDLRDMLESFALLNGMATNFRTFFDSLKKTDPVEHKRLRNIFNEYSTSIQYAHQALKAEATDRIVQLGVENGIQNNTRLTKEPGVLDMFTYADDSQNPIYQTAWAIISEQQEKTRQETMKFGERIQEKLTALKGSPGFTSLQDSFDLLLDDDTGDLIHKYSKEHYQEVEDRRKKRDITWLKERFEISEERYKGFDNRKAAAFKRINERFLDVLDAEGKIEEDRSKLRERLKQAWLDKNDFSKDAAWFGPAAAKFLVLKEGYEQEAFSDRFNAIKDNKALVDFYEFYQETNRTLARMTGKKINQSHVANIRQDFAEAVRSGNIPAIPNLLDNLKIEENDPTMGAKSRDPITGEEVASIPLLYLNKLRDKEGAPTIEGKTRDIGTALMLQFESAMNYVNMESIEDQIMLMHDFLQEQETLLEDPSGNAFYDWTGGLAKKLTSTGLANNFEKLYLNRLVYGQRLQGKDFDIGGYSASKIASATMQFFSAKVLGLSGTGAAAAHLAANAAAVMESRKGIHYTRKQYTQASKEQALRDPTFNAVNDLFEIEADDKTHRRATNLSAHKGFKKVVSMDTLFITFRIADESVERRILGAMTKQYGIDENGMPKRLDKLPEGTESIFEKTQKIVENLKEEDNVDLAKAIGLSEKGYAWFRSAARVVARSVKGMPSQTAPNIASTNIFMRGLMQFKTWMPSLVQERFGNLRYRKSTDTFEHGRYKVIGRELLGNSIGFKQAIKNIGIEGMKLMAEAATYGYFQKEVNKEAAAKDFKDYKDKNLDNLDIQDMSLDDFTNMRRGQIRAFAAELRALMMIAAAFILLNLKGDDDEELWKEYWATRKLFKTLNKTRTEIGFMLNPKELANSLGQTSMPVVGLFSDLVDVGENTVDESMDFITGREDKNDTTGWFYHSSRFLPGAHSVTRFFEVTEGDIQLARRGG